MRKLLSVLLILIIAACIAPVLVRAADISVSFEVVSVSPVGATVRATITNATGKAMGKIADIKLTDTMQPVKAVKAETVSVETYTEDVPVYGERPITEAEIKDIELSGEYPKDYKIPDTVFDVVSYDKVEKQREVRKQESYYGPAALKASMTAPVNLKPSDVTVMDFTITTGSFWNGEAWETKGTLALVIDGIEYKDLTHSSWWDTSWLHRVKLTFDNTASAENLINFPVLAKLNAGNIDYGETQADGGDLRFIDSDDVTECDYEIELWDSAADSFVWVEVPQINSGVNTDFVYMYYGNDFVGNGWDVTGTWNANYTAVYHMNDLTTSTIKDSKGTYNGTKKAANEPVQIAATIGYGQSFDGLDDFVQLSGTIGFNNNYTLEFIGSIEAQDYLGVVTSNIGYYEYLRFGNAGGLYDDRFFGESHTNGDFIWLDFDAPPIATGTPYHFVVTENGVNKWEQYIDSALQATSTISVDSRLDIRRIGNGRLNTDFFKGVLDEIRISNTLRSADWIEATYLSNTDSFITYTAAEHYPQAPTDFTVTQTGDMELTLDWTAGTYSTATVIIRQIARYPADILDGEEVYNGAGVTYADGGLNLEDAEYFYRAWGHNAAGYSLDYAENKGGGLGMILLCLLAVTFGMIGLSFWQRSYFLSIVCSVVAIGFGIYWIAQDPSFIYLIEGMVAVAIGVYMLVMVGVDLLKGN